MEHTERECENENQLVNAAEAVEGRPHALRHHLGPSIVSPAARWSCAGPVLERRSTRDFRWRRGRCRAGAALTLGARLAHSRPKMAHSRPKTGPQSPQRRPSPPPRHPASLSTCC
eukprot:1939564-Prymnesium_polylepis.1